MARTRAEDFERKQRNLLLDAARVFAEQGMEKASMAQIAAEAGVSKSLLYHYYPSKDALIFSIIETHLTELDDALAEADRPDAAPEDRLRLLVRTVLEKYRGADDQHKVQLNAAAALSPDQRACLTEIERRIVRRFSAVLTEIRPELKGPGTMLMPVTMSLFGMMNWVYMWFKEGGPISRDDYADLATRLMLGGLGNLD
ncbi:TetR/AcrR family transcriptional regulator [Rhodovulum sp. BSW8]|uniref:TetR family transcriptional regulator n=1 Tax=Rhodovulum visakhapatnamense TaxID=364297 RepID=A0A4R8GC23_9RHOB|nr:MULTISPECIES: TetR/AcrR family transcriptional regulator [Rhodovulum]OLS43803.1 TetR family transcriptional regulator [Rhodovulum sulfidophilum]MBL3568637.1 TetR family transcriptional regulator [Rhodovulum visakhapatnamense]MBL3578475.1 TetR family transcriptional regulator [Rhodovulum visakhapatnamense]RBO52396.1 TetR/AcrR family transcriptional regulator [Rhodovulum sp. BSW8]TDX33260.1 TetR family transcriptional regulator [Rhodovulum visakhapatnamense]